MRLFGKKEQGDRVTGAIGTEATALDGEGGKLAPLAIKGKLVFPPLPWPIELLFHVSCWATFLSTVVVLPACAVRYRSSPKFGPMIVVSVTILVLGVLVLCLLYCVTKRIKIRPVVPLGRDAWTAHEERGIDEVMFTIRLTFVAAYLLASGLGFLALWFYGAWNPTVFDDYKLVPFCPSLFVAYTFNYLATPSLVRHFHPNDTTSHSNLRRLGSYILLWTTATTAVKNLPMELGDVSGAGTALSHGGSGARPRKSN